MLKAYPMETVVAEKFQAMLMLGIANSRMKDFYDVWTLAEAVQVLRPDALCGNPSDLREAKNGPA